jgi:nitrite reductase/ring-hydroxylating ferredoxin subunit
MPEATAPATPGAPFTPVAKVGDILPGQGQAYAVSGRMVAIFNEDGKYFAIDDFCPHMGASLAGGYLEARDRPGTPGGSAFTMEMV